MTAYRVVACVVGLVLAGHASAAPSTSAAQKGEDCTSADGVTVHSGQSVVPTNRGNAGHVMSIFFSCRDGKWLFNGRTPVASPTFGSDYTVVDR